MSRDRHRAVATDGDPVDGWPVHLTGVTETIVATMGPNGRWNQAALGVFPPESGGHGGVERGATAAVEAKTYGRTRTRRNLEAGRAAIVQFTTDPVDFVDAALSTVETDEPILERTAAWTRIEGTERDRTVDRGTEILTWSLVPVASAVRERSVPTANRGRAAAIEATVPASRLDVEGYDEGALLDRLADLESVVDAAGDERARTAFARIDEHVDWRDRIC